jgi:uncharacterized membrane protein
VDDPRVGRVARLLGFAGLAPSIATTVLVALGERSAAAIGAFYPLLILSFLGGMWWGLAMREGAVRQAWLVGVAIVPSLVALALGCAVVFTQGSGWSLVGIGVALIVTLPVDRWLARRGAAPAGWMGLRVPLSLALGALTIATGAMLGTPAVQY